MMNSLELKKKHVLASLPFSMRKCFSAKNENENENKDDSFIMKYNLYLTRSRSTHFIFYFLHEI